MSDTTFNTFRAKALWKDFRPLLALILLCGLILRLSQLNAPMEYDEAYTVVGFANHSWWASLSDYSLPNNHIFHTLLVRASLIIFGVHTWAVRLPALLFGLGIVLAVYWLGKDLYSPETGLVSAALAAFLPALVDLSTKARGYSLVAFFCLISFWSAEQILRKNDLRFWLLLTLSCALGAWAVPVMLYPAGAVYLWLVAEGPRKHNFYLRWFASGLTTGLGSVLLYTPALIVSGWRRILANGFVQPVNEKKYFDWVLVTRLSDTWQTWMNQVPWILVGILVTGFVLALVLNRRISSRRWPLALVILAWCLFLLLVRRPEAFDRFWSWLIAPFLIWAAAGWVESLHVYWAKHVSFPRVLVWLSILSLVIYTLISLSGIPQNWVKVGNVQASTQYLAGILQPGDEVLAGYPNNAAVWYYLTELGKPDTFWRASTQAKRYLVLLATNQKDQTIESIFKSYQVPPESIDIKGAILLREYGKIQIYTCQLLK